jgi:nucleotide-binding universal stress UspA family protein
MFQRILVPVDLTDRHGPTVELAGRLAGSGGEVIVLHVIEVMRGLSREEDAGFYRRLEEKGKKHVDRLVDALHAKKVAARGQVLYGDRVGEIVGFAAREKADLIALSSHAFDPARPRAGAGGLSYQVGYLAPCPVLLVK